MARLERSRLLRGFGGLLVLGGLAYGALLHWWWTAPMLAMGEEIAALRDEELALRMESSQRDELRTRLLALVQQFEQGQPGFLPEANRELAGAALVQRVEAVLATASPGKHCKLTARTPVESNAKEPFMRVMVQVRLNCDMADLAAVLHALESGSPQLFVDNLDLLSRREFLGAAEAAGGNMDVSFDLYGYLKTSAAAADSSPAGGGR